MTDIGLYRIREGVPPDTLSRRRTLRMAISLPLVHELALMIEFGLDKQKALMLMWPTKLRPTDWLLSGEQITYSLDRELWPNSLGARVWLLTVHTWTPDLEAPRWP